MATTGPNGKRIGRPTKLNPRVQETIVANIRNGNYVEVAVVAAGIGRATYTRWMETGEADEEHGKDTIYRAFRAAVTRAAAEAEADALKILRDALPEDPRLVIMWLERRFPDRWHKRHHHEVQVEADVEVVHNKVVEVTPDVARREEIARILATAEGMVN